MNHETDAHALDVLDHIRPTVVVRRRIWEPPPRPERRAEAFVPHDEPEASSKDDAPDSELGPDFELGPDSELGPPAPMSPLPSPPRRVLTLSAATSLPELAHRMDVSASDLVAELVARGWFEVNARTTIPHRAVKEVAAAFGWDVAPCEDDVPPSRASGVVLVRAARRAASVRPPRPNAKPGPRRRGKSAPAPLTKSRPKGRKPAARARTRAA